MGSTRHRKRRGSSGTNKPEKSNNIMVLKLVDPLVQSLLIIFFLYCLDSEQSISYRTVLWIIVGWQLLSVFINFFLGDLKLLKNERIIYLVTMSLYMIFYFYYERHVPERMVALDIGTNANIPLHRVVVTTIAVAIAFWYNIICYREIRTLLGGVINTGK